MKFVGRLTQTSKSRYPSKTTPGSILALYNDFKERLKKSEKNPANFGPDEITPTKTHEIFRNTLFVRDPGCYRISNAYAQAGRGDYWAATALFNQKIEVSRLKTGVTVCTVKVINYITGKLYIGPFVKVGGRWIWAPGPSP
jgi:hypothetical protein